MRRLLFWTLAVALALALLGPVSPSPEPSLQPSPLANPGPSAGGSASADVPTVALEAENARAVRRRPPRAKSRPKARAKSRPKARAKSRAVKRRAASRTRRRKTRAPVRVATPPPPPAPPPGPPAPQFHGSAQPIDGATRSRMTASWRPGCPVPIEDLRLLTLDHWGFDGGIHRGELVVHRDQAGQVLHAMGRLFEARFPVERMQLVDVYGGDDDRSMAANNTSAFNCRPVSGQPGVWSQHSYGWAIDINPVQNPYVSGGRASPPAGAAYMNRSSRHPGVVHAGVVQAFASVGWGWGGNWGSPKDYQHFSATGR